MPGFTAYRPVRMDAGYFNNIDTPTIVIELADSTRAGVFKPVYDDKQSSATLMLLMPMMINA